MKEKIKTICFILITLAILIVAIGYIFFQYKEYTLKEEKMRAEIEIMEVREGIKSPEEYRSDERLRRLMDIYFKK